MTEPARDRELEQLLDVARVAEPRSLEALPARRMVRVAIARADRAPRRPVVVALRWLIPALVAAGLALALLRPRSTAIELAEDALPLRLSLKSGDALVIAAATRLRVLDDAAALRKVEIERGSVLFEVAKLGPGQAFEVQTRAATVRVVGTIFTVEVAPDQTVVRVHEGEVRVGEALLSADEVWSSAGTRALGAGPFADEARALVQSRSGKRIHGDGAGALRGPSEEQAARVSPIEVATSEPPPETERDATSEPRAEGSRQGAAPPLQQAPRVSPELDQKQLLARAHASLRAGDAAGALRIAAAYPDDDALALLTADALRVLGRFAEAITQYEQLAARTADGLTRAHAGFAAAQLALHKLHDAEGALTLVSRFGLREQHAPLRERASALYVDALLALDRGAEAREEARSYLAREPETASSARMRALLD